MKRKKLFRMTCLLILLFFLQGCATNISFVRKDLTSISPLKVVRYETPRMKKTTLGRLLVGAVLLGGVGVELSQSILAPEAPLDIGELIVKNFIEHASKEIPNWPITTVEEQPVGEDYAYHSSSLLEFKVSFFSLHGMYGLMSVTTATMKDSSGNILWQKTFQYWSKKFDRYRSIDEFEADNGKLLKEEVIFTAEKTAMDLVAHFKGEGKE